MVWEVENTDKFKGWRDTLDGQDRLRLVMSVKLLEKYDPTLKLPLFNKLLKTFPCA